MFCCTVIFSYTSQQECSVELCQDSGADSLPRAGYLICSFESCMLQELILQIDFLLEKAGITTSASEIKKTNS